MEERMKPWVTDKHTHKHTQTNVSIHIGTRLDNDEQTERERECVCVCVCTRVCRCENGAAVAARLISTPLQSALELSGFPHSPPTALPRH